MEKLAVKVKISDMAILKGEGLLVTIGLGSCVGIAIYDPENKVGGLAHILLPDSAQFKNRLHSFNPAKFADTAIPLLMEKMEKAGARKFLFRAKIAGGGQLFAFQKTGPSIGGKNVEAVKYFLNKYRIPIRGEDVGGDRGRTMRFDVNSGRVLITMVGESEKIL